MEALRSRVYSGSLSKRITWLVELSLVTPRRSRNDATHSTSTSFYSVSKFGRTRRYGRYSTNSSRCPVFGEPPIWTNSRPPPPSTLCKAFNRLDMAVWRVLLNLSVSLLPTNGVVGIDASGFDRSHGSKHYTKRAKLTIQQLKVTLLVDTRSNAIIDVHVTTTRKHDSQTAPSLPRRGMLDWMLISMVSVVRTRRCTPDSNASTVRSSGHGTGGNSFDNSLSLALLTISTDYSNR